MGDSKKLTEVFVAKALPYTGLKFPLGERAEEVRQLARDFSQKEIAPIAAEADAENAFPNALWPKLGALGLLGMTVDEKYGGTGLGYIEHIVAMEEISRASGGIGLSYGAHSNLCVNQIHLNGSEEQKMKYLPGLCAGTLIGALAMSESEAGSDVMSMTLRAELKGDRYILNGTKMWITNGPDADVLVVYAKTDPAAGSKGVTAFIIEKDFKGFSPGQKIDKHGMRSSNTSELIFDNCEVPAENVMRLPGDGARVLMSGLDYERAVLAAGPIGIMQACMDLVLPYMHERKQFGKAIGENQLMKGKIADMYSSLNAARAYVYAVGQACDRGQVTREDAAGAILHASEAGVRVADEAVQALGGNGYTTNYPAERFLRDVKLYTIGAGTNEIRRELIGRQLLKMSQP